MVFGEQPSGNMRRLSASTSRSPQSFRSTTKAVSAIIHSAPKASAPTESRPAAAAPTACPHTAGTSTLGQLAGLSGLSLPTIQRMEGSDGVIRGNVDSLMKLVGALDTAGIELIGEGAASAARGRGVRLKTRDAP